MMGGGIASLKVVILFVILVLPLSVLCLSRHQDRNNVDDNQLSELYRSLYSDYRRDLERPSEELPALSNIYDVPEQEDALPSSLDLEERLQPGEKRGRFQGFCFRRSKTGRKVPYICWRESES